MYTGKNLQKKEQQLTFSLRSSLEYMEQKKRYYMSMMTAGEICDIIDSRIKELGRNITNEEVNQLLTEEAIKRNAVIAVSENKEDLDADMITGNLREDGLKVLNLNEEARKEQRRKDNGEEPQ